MIAGYSLIASSKKQHIYIAPRLREIAATNEAKQGRNNFTLNKQPIMALVANQ